MCLLLLWLAGATSALAQGVCTEGSETQEVRMVTILGDLELTLCTEDAPVTVENFLSYVQSEAYTHTGFIHRSVQSDFFIFQGGGYFVDTSPGGIEFINSIARQDSIPLEYGLPHDRGTIAMARTNALDSATSEWFINNEDNTAIFNQENQYAVFGSLSDGSLPVMDAIGALAPTFISPSVFSQTPLLNGYPGGNESFIPYLVMVTDVVEVPEPDASLQVLVSAIGFFFLARRRQPSLARSSRLSHG